MNSTENRLIVVSNRLPVIVEKENGDWKVYPGTGGLVTALAPVLKNRGGLWIGWPGSTEEETFDLQKILNTATKDSGYTLKPVLFTSAERDKFYCGFSNEIIWPLFHDLQSNCNFDPEYWRVYERVNVKFAQVITENGKKDDFIWVHDYHLMNVAKELRNMGKRYRTGFFLHIPFPPLDIFLKLPWRFQILHALLEYDLIGFQTLRDRRNFVQCIRTLIKNIVIRGKGQVLTIRHGDRDIRCGTFPIGIDSRDFAKRAATPEVSRKAWYIHEDLPKSMLVLGVDRLDYTKGIPYRLRAFQNVLERFPDLHNRIRLIQIVVPSREDIPKYRDLKMEIERRVSEINGKYTRSGWVPIHYLFRHLEKEELLAYYRTSEIALVTPLKDGMNLVAMEYCASSLEENCVLILSEFAGAAAQLQKGALLVNPYDIEGVADTIYKAFNMKEEERRLRMRKLKRVIRERNIFRWVDSFLRTAIGKKLDQFPLLDDYFPETKIN